MLTILGVLGKQEDKDIDFLNDEEKVYMDEVNKLSS